MRDVAEEDRRVGVRAVELIPDELARFRRPKSATSVVLPEPAGAATSVTGCSRFERSRSKRRARSSRAGAGRGGRSLVRRKKAGAGVAASAGSGGSGDVTNFSVRRGLLLISLHQKPSPPIRRAPWSFARTLWSD